MKSQFKSPALNNRNWEDNNHLLHKSSNQHNNPANDGGIPPRFGMNPQYLVFCCPSNVLNRKKYQTCHVADKGQNTSYDILLLQEIEKVQYLLFIYLYYLLFIYLYYKSNIVSFEFLMSIHPGFQSAGSFQLLIQYNHRISYAQGYQISLSKSWCN